MVVLCVTGAAAQNKSESKADKAAELKRVLDAKRYIFRANIAYPQADQALMNLNFPQGSAASIPLNYNYDLTLSNDTLSAFLPYYGRAFTAPTNPTEGGIKFKTTKFDYTSTAKKNGTLQIIFKPQGMDIRGPSDVFRMVLTVSPGGYANLQVICTNRAPISFSGMVEEIKPKSAS